MKTVWIAGAALGLVLAILAVTAAVPQEREPSPTGPDEEPTTVRANLDSRDRSRMSVSHREFVDAALAWSMRRCRGVPVSALSVAERRNLVLFAYECSDENAIIAEQAFVEVGGCSAPELAAVTHLMFRGVRDGTVEEDRGILEFVCKNPASARHPAILLLTVLQAAVVRPSLLARDATEVVMTHGYGAPLIPACLLLLASHPAAEAVIGHW